MSDNKVHNPQDEKLEPGDERWTCLPDGSIDVEYAEDPEMDAAMESYAIWVEGQRRESLDRRA